jgi:hypothetical protein
MSARSPVPKWVLNSYVKEMTKAIDLFNALHAGSYEKQILGLIDDLKEVTPVNGDLSGEVKIVFPTGKEEMVPSELFAFLATSAKHLGDMAMRYSRKGK